MPGANVMVNDPEGPVEFDDGSVEVTVAESDDPISGVEDVARGFQEGGMVMDLSDPSDPAGPAVPPGMGREPPEGEIPFDANLADYVDEADLKVIGEELIARIEADERSRHEWLETYTKGLRLLGFKMEERTVPWPKACGVFHPVLTESVIRFEAQSIMEVFPAAGPVKTDVIGVKNPQREEQAERVKRDLNWICTELMEDYREETEQLLFHLPIVGSAFRKGYWDPTLQMPRLHFVPAEDFIVPYEASSLATAERYTHRIRMSPNEIRKFQVAGLYRDVDLPAASKTVSGHQDAVDRETGRTQTMETDDRHEIMECHTVYDMPGFEDETGVELPYVVTFDRDSREVLGIYRNWKEQDPVRKRRMWFSEYKYLPGLGFYGTGLIHIIGGLAQAVTSTLRQLVDAGTLNNLPSGYKSKDLRVKGDNTPIKPGEWRDTDALGSTLRDSFFALPTKEPSAVLFQLLQNMVEEARRLGSVVDMKVSDMSQQAPVGTTFALLERAMKVQSAVQARLHRSFKNEFRILAGLVRDHMPDPYPFDVGGPFTRGQDYDDRVDVVPVSDPNASTMAQRIMQHQAALQLSGTAPQIYDMRVLHRGMLRAMGMDNAEQIVPPPPDVKPRDPVTENMDLINNRPVKAGIWQDHEAHLTVHLAMLEDPRIGEISQNSPSQNAIAAAASAHVAEHLAFHYRREIEKELGVQLPPPGEPLPEDVEVRLSRLVAEAADRLLKRNVAVQQREEVMEKLQDPMVQMQREETEIKKADLQRKAAVDEARVDQQEKDRVSKETLERERMAIEASKALLDAGVDSEKAQLQHQTALGKAGVEVAKEVVKAELTPKPKPEKKDA